MSRAKRALSESWAGIKNQSRTRALRLWSLVVSSALSAIGCFTQRGGIVQPLYGVMEYGMPHAEHNVVGTVRSSLDSSPVPGIRVVLSESNSPYADTSETDQLGRYSLHLTIPCNDATLQIRSVDVDGDRNGRFAEADTQFVIPSQELRDGEEWICGKAQKTIDISMDPLN